MPYKNSLKVEGKSNGMIELSFREAESWREDGHSNERNVTRTIRISEEKAEEIISGLEELLDS